MRLSEDCRYPVRSKVLKYNYDKAGRRKVLYVGRQLPNDSHGHDLSSNRKKLYGFFLECESQVGASNSNEQFRGVSNVDYHSYFVCRWRASTPVVPVQREKRAGKTTFPAFLRAQWDDFPENRLFLSRRKPHQIRCRGHSATAAIFCK